LRSVAQIKAAVARVATGQPWRLSSLMLETMAAGPKPTRRLQVAVGTAAGAEPALRAIHFMLSEDGLPVLNYHVTVRPSPPPMSVVFLFPRGGEAEEPPWVTGALGCLAGKRSSDLWAYLPWRPAGGASPAAPAAQANEEFPFTPNHEALENSFRRMTQRADCGDMWQTLWRALRAESSLARGKRHVIVFAAEQVRGVAGPGLVATVGASRGIVQVISSVSNPGLEDLCEKTRISYTHAPAAELVQDAVVRDHRARNQQGESLGCRLQLADEPLPLARERLDEAGRGGGIRQRLAEALHGRVDAVLELDHRAVRPQARLDLLAGDQLARPIQQHGQDGEGLAGYM